MRDVTDSMTHGSLQKEHVSTEYPLSMQYPLNVRPGDMNTPANNFWFRTYNTRTTLDIGAYYDYNRPSTSCTLSTSDELAGSLVTSSAVIAFNNAIACHLYGKRSGQIAPVQQATQSYDLALGILRQTATQQEYEKFLTCLALNNLAVIQNEPCYFEHSRMCFERLRDLLDKNPCIHCQQFASESMADAEWSNLELNVTCSKCPLSAQAA
jgi:hypothetical protein